MLRPADMLIAFLAPALALLAAAGGVAALDAVTGVASARWLVIHLAFVGGVSQLVLGVSQFFVAAFLATNPPSKRAIALQLALWNAGTLTVAYGVVERLDPAIDAGAALLVAALVAYAAGLRGMQRRSLQRARFAVRWYYAAAALLLPGILAGALLARGTAWTHGDLLSAHMALNVGGWFGTAIVGTLHTFFPSLTATRLQLPRLEPVAMAGWLGGIAAVAVGYGFDMAAFAAAGWLVLLGAAAALAANLGGSLARTEGRPSAPALALAAAHGLLLVGLTHAAAITITDAGRSPIGFADRSDAMIVILAAWLGLTVAGSLARLLGLLASIRSVRARRP